MCASDGGGLARGGHVGSKLLRHACWWGSKVGRVCPVNEMLVQGALLPTPESSELQARLPCACVLRAQALPPPLDGLHVLRALHGPAQRAGVLGKGGEHQAVVGLHLWAAVGRVAVVRTICACHALASANGPALLLAWR